MGDENMISTGDLDFACNCDGLNEDEMYARLTEQESNVLQGKCLTCFHMSEYNENSHDCTVSADVVNIEDNYANVETHGCECWEDAAEA